MPLHPKATKRSKSGYVGVFRRGPTCWQARIGNRVIGHYRTFGEARLARQEAEGTYQPPKTRRLTDGL